jgi:predicted ATP-dependent protease
LYNYDEDFKKLFKVKADFDSVMEASADNVQEICSLVAAICKEESLLPADDEALAKILEQSHRLADHQEKLITETDDIADLLREADYYARASGAATISAQHIFDAIREKHYRSDLIHEKIKELIASDVIFIDTTGEKIGQVNGLSVMDMGDIAFGRPSRITASVSMGQGVIIDVEKEAKMSGPIHTKGVLILSGFLFDNFGRDKPLNLAVSLVFEQSYSGVDGDSASSTELYAILSRLADVPIKQGIAVTGSVNQRGEVQPVGGINQKIEGYFEVCRMKGLTGEQGVMIPQSNVSNLMLKPEVVEAVAAGQFHIWAVGHITEGIAILTGMEAGQGVWNRQTGTMEFQPDTVFFRVNEELRRMSDYMRKINDRD